LDAEIYRVCVRINVVVMNIREVVANLRLFHKHCTYPRSDMVTGNE